MTWRRAPLVTQPTLIPSESPKMIDDNELGDGAASAGHPARNPDAAELLTGVKYHTWPQVPRGGQHCGVPLGILAIHPSGIAVFEEDQRSQMQNRKAADARLLVLLRAVGVSTPEAEPTAPSPELSNPLAPQ